MKGFATGIVLLLVSISACKTTKVDVQHPENNGKLLVTMERTGCYGKCPIYQFSIYENGAVFYEGVRFTDQVGKFYTTLTPKEVSGLRKKLDEAGLFELADKYPDSKMPPVDLPACKLFYYKDGREKKITDFGIKSPDSLKAVEKVLDDIVKSKILQKADK